MEQFSRDTDYIMVAGPTASGKSALAIDLAQAFDGVVINADSMQIYRDLAIVTACPDEDEQSGKPPIAFIMCLMGQRSLVRWASGFRLSQTRWQRCVRGVNCLFFAVVQPYI